MLSREKNFLKSDCLVSRMCSTPLSTMTSSSRRVSASASTLTLNLSPWTISTQAPLATSTAENAAAGVRSSTTSLPGPVPKLPGLQFQGRASATAETNSRLANRRATRSRDSGIGFMVNPFYIKWIALLLLVSAGASNALVTECRNHGVKRRSQGGSRFPSSPTGC